MTRYLLRRIPSAVLVLFLASIVIFAVIRLVPGDPVAALAGPDATAASQAAIRHHLGLDRPVPVQYVDWLGGLVRGHLGTSYVVGGSISSLLRHGLGNTALLTVAALLFAVVVGTGLSLVAVIVGRPWVDAVVTAFATLGVALPTFVTGLVLIVVLGVLLPVLPAGGTPPAGLLAQPAITAQYLLLPAVCLGLPVAAALVRFLTEGLREQLEQPYVTTATALGIGRRRIVLTQVLRNALPPTLTMLGIQVGALLGGAVLVEAIFSWPGLGQLIQQAITGRDYPLVQVLLMLSVAVFVLTQLVTDVVHAWLDPRIRLGGTA